MLTPTKKRILLDMISTGDYSNILKLAVVPVDCRVVSSSLKITDSQKINYYKAQKLGDVLVIEKNKLKKNIVNLLAFELNTYTDEYVREKIFKKLNVLVSNLVAHPPKTRICKFLTKFIRASKAMRDLVENGQQDGILKTIRNIVIEMKKC